MLGYMEKRKEDGEESIKNGKETINFYSPHQFEYMVVNVVNGVRDGYAALYEDGIKKIEWEFVNGKRSGMFTVYKYGLREFSGWWNEDGVWDSRYYVEYTAHANMLVHCHPTTGTIIYRGGMGKNYKIREGWGVTYDLVTGLPEQYGFFIDNKLVRVYKRFGQNQIMYEYSYDDDNVVLQNDPKQSCKAIMEHGDAHRRCIYSGGYIQKDGAFYVRNGEGCEKEGNRVFHGVWENGECIDRFEIIDGYGKGRLLFDCFQPIRGKANESNRKQDKKMKGKVEEVVKKPVESFKKQPEIEKRNNDSFKRSIEERPVESFRRNIEMESKPNEEVKRSLEEFRKKPSEFFPSSRKDDSRSVSSTSSRQEDVRSIPQTPQFIPTRQNDSRSVSSTSSRQEDVRFIPQSSQFIPTRQENTPAVSQPSQFIPASRSKSSRTLSNEPPIRNDRRVIEDDDYEPISEEDARAMLSRLEKRREEDIENLPSLYAKEEEEEETIMNQPVKEKEEFVPVMKSTTTQREATFSHNVVKEEHDEESDEEETPMIQRNFIMREEQDEEGTSELSEEKKAALTELFQQLVSDIPQKKEEENAEEEKAIPPEETMTTQEMFGDPIEDDNFVTDVEDVKPPVLSRHVEEEYEISPKGLTAEQQKDLEKLMSEAMNEKPKKVESFVMQEEEEEEDSKPSEQDIEELIRRKVEERNRGLARQRSIGPMNDQPKSRSSSSWSQSSPFILHQNTNEPTTPTSSSSSWKPRSLAQDPSQWLSQRVQSQKAINMLQQQRQFEESHAIKSMKSSSYNDDNMYRVTLYSTAEYQEMSSAVTHIVVADNSCNDGVLWRFNVSDCKGLIELYIGKNCFKNVEEVTICDLQNLEKISIGDNSFIIDEPLKEHRRFSITDITRLYKIEIGEHVAEDFYEFELRGMNNRMNGFIR